MRKVFTALAALAAVLMGVGCFETRQDFTLNPDGSGKVVFEMTVQDMSLNMPSGAEKPDPELQAKAFVKQTLEGAGGVETWSDVSHERLPDGRIRFRGTAYFRDFSKLKFQSPNMQGVSFTKDDQGGMVLLLDDTKSEGGSPPAQQPPPPEQLAARVQEERLKYQQMRMMLEAILGKVKVDFSFRLPGTVVEATNFQKEPSGALRIVMEGAKMLQVMDQLMADDAYVREVVLGGRGGGAGQMNEFVREKLFGSKGPVRARVTGPFVPLFAYESEVSAAKANYPKMIERLGLDKLPQTPPGPPVPPGFGGQGKGGAPPAEPASPAQAR